jgi:hypothetical protein
MRCKYVARLRLRGHYAVAPSVRSLLSRVRLAAILARANVNLRTTNAGEGNHRSSNRVDRRANPRNGARNRRGRATATLFGIRAAINPRSIRHLRLR